MVTQTWDLLYGRQPLSRDAVLFVVALALHLPLFLMEVKAPLKPGDNKNPLVVIEMREAAISRVMAQGMGMPSPLPTKLATTIDLSHLIKTQAALPPPTMVPINQPVSINRIQAPVIPPALIESKNLALPSKGTVGSLTPNVSPLEKIIDKGQFLVAQNTIGSIDEGSHSISVGKTHAIVVPTGAVPRGEVGIAEPSTRSGKILLASPPLVEPAVPVTTLKKDAHVGAPIAFADEPENKEISEFAVIKAKPRDLSKEQIQKELFPVQGELKDRGIAYQEIPEYPEWAQKKGIESSVRFRFWVTPDGRVKENIQLVRGSGYPELDELAKSALQRWVFHKLPQAKGNVVEQGDIEFRFSVK